jgi:hypothetical protein
MEAGPDMRQVSNSGHGRLAVLITPAVLLPALLLLADVRVACSATLPWNSPDRYRILLTVDPRGVTPRSHSPTAPLRINFQAKLTSLGDPGLFDEHTIEVISYDAAGNPRVYDPARTGYEQYLVPWRIDPYYRLDEVDLVFVMPDQNCLQYAVYFDTAASGHGRPDRYPGIVGDGDFFRQQSGRREIGPSMFGDLCDFDGDGDLDLFEGGCEPFIYCYENLYNQVGEQRLVPRGRLTSDGQVLMPSMAAGSNRAWMTVTLYDWDGDGDQDLFPTFMDGPDMGYVVFFRNDSPGGGPPRFNRVDRMYTVGGQALGSGNGGGFFPAPTFVRDWDGTGDNLTDILVTQSGFLYLYRNLSPGGSTGFLLADGVKLQAGGADIWLLAARVDCADIDGDGDLDLLATSHNEPGEWADVSKVYWYKNIGSRQSPQFASPVVLSEMRHHYPGLKVGDFFGNDGLLDIAVGTFWHDNAKLGLPKSFGGLLKNSGPPGNPAFELALADAGSFYTEQFQTCDAGQQNGVRVRDLDGDGDLDLIASTTDGMVLFFRNIGDNLYPLFAPAENLMIGGANPSPILVYGPEEGYARLDVADWNNDGHPDLIVADEEARVFLFLNDGQGHDPPTFLAGMQLYANGKPIDGIGRGSVLVCDWNNDGRKDLILGMAPKDNVSSPYYDWPYQDGDTDKTDDQGFLYYQNTGTDANPVLAYPSWLRAGGQIITYTRPNLGSFVDWDKDGKKDFIGCEFESNVRLYRNTGSGSPNTVPTLSPAAGTILVQPFVTTQMISGAEAVDWRGDGDLDIVTGQGHGGNGLRFYERDYINDFVNKTVYNNDTFPMVTVVATERYGLRADFDGDRDVDQQDFGLLQRCLSASGATPGPDCIVTDLDSDGTVGASDFVIFQRCLSGPYVSADPNCAH